MTKPLLAIDWDGTIVENKWPGFGEFQPGAVKYLKQLLRDNDIIVYSARLNNHYIDGKLRTEDELLVEQKYVRDTLDKEGLCDIMVWKGEDCKPSALVFLDDRAIHHDGSWRRSYHAIRRQLGQI